jgi:hypothetical protein
MPQLIVKALSWFDPDTNQAQRPTRDETPAHSRA